MYFAATGCHENQSNIPGEIEPYGWKIGLKNPRKDTKIVEEAAAHNEEVKKQKTILKHQRQQQMLLKKGVDRLLSDRFYRQMYENFKEREGQFPAANPTLLLPHSDNTKIIDQSVKNPNPRKKQYSNHLARILSEDCMMESPAEELRRNNRRIRNKSV